MDGDCRKNGTKEFAAAFAPNAALDASVLHGPCVGADAIGSFFAATAGGMYDSLAFTNETVDGRKIYLEWEGKAFGKDIAGTTIVTRDEAGLIQSVRLYHRPLPVLLQFARALAKRLKGQGRSKPVGHWNKSSNASGETLQSDAGDCRPAAGFTAPRPSPLRANRLRRPDG
jgi:hypothetical protein